VVRSRKYRAEVIAAVKTFRPVLTALKIREPEQHRPVFIAEFDHLHLLDLDFCSIEILLADLDECTGIFVSAYTKTGLLRNYIILHKSLFDISRWETREQLKITAVHEFCHFIAILYAATAVTIDVLKGRIIQRLNARIDRFPKETLIKIYNLLSARVPQEDQYFDELTDRHFRLDVEGETPDYNILFYHFMFSKDLLETDFTADKQAEFRRLIETGNKRNGEQAINLLIESIEKVALDKCVPFRLAFNQVLEWVHTYA
jgi:hypothetical protein